MKRFQRLAFFAAGCVITVAAFFLRDWIHVAVQALGLSGEYYADTPGWVRAAQRAIILVPWLALFSAIAARALWGRAVRLFSFAAGLATPYLALLAFLLLGPVVEDHWHRQAFEAAVWRKAPGNDWSPWPVRLTMVDDLLDSGALHGKTRQEIESLLGPRDDTDYFRSWDLVYRLGPERGLFRIDSEWLVINLGPDGRASEITLVSD